MKKTILVGIGIILLFSAIFISTNHEKNIDERRDNFISLKESIQHDMLADGKYRCCLVNPCTYCIEKTPGHGEGAECSCLKDVMEGKHPCGECIGEILEGHGNPLIAEYYAKAIAEEVGTEHYDELKIIISNKYNITIKEQI